jgi:hypothetical protein
MKALSLWQPWAWLIANGHKDIENRTWNTRFRGTFLIHASMTYDPHVTPQHFETWGIALPSSGTFQRGGIVGIATLTDVVKQSDSPWFFGPYGFLLKDARPLLFTPLRGQRYFFEVPQEIIDALVLQAQTPESLTARALATYPGLFDTVPGPQEGRVRAFEADIV